MVMIFAAVPLRANTHVLAVHYVLSEAPDNFVRTKPSRRKSYLRATTMDSVGPNASTDISRNPALASHPCQSAGV